ncbi:MAG: M48 family metallopeptidase, partial [Nitrosomonadaceae bacterium]
MTNLLFMVVFGYINSEQMQDGGSFFQKMDWQTFAVVSAGVSVVVLMGSLYKIIALSAGGKTVAEALGGQLIPQNTGDLKQRKLLNVVEEMAIASGTPAPPVYLLMDEPGINAFAAGFTPRDAVIGITQGAIDHLSRDQLQGVIAHEFSHIFNGDMRLNIRLMGVLYGIVIIGMAGYYLLYSASFSRRRVSNNKGVGGIMVLAIGLMVIGFSGTFFGNLIKAAVSRQREYLADASAVQFTRNPDGIAGALKRIGGLKFGSKVSNPDASEVSHAFFAQGVSGFMQMLSAT